MGLYKLRKVDREIPKRANTTKISTPVMAAVAPHNWMPPCKQPWYFVAITLTTTNNSVIITPDHPLILDNTPLSMLFISSYHQSYGINVPKTHPRGSSRGSSYLLWLSISFGATTSVDRWYLAHKLTTTKHGRIFTNTRAGGRKKKTTLNQSIDWLLTRYSWVATRTLKSSW